VIARSRTILVSVVRKVVVSDSLTPAEAEGWGDPVRVVPRAAAHQVVAELKAQDGGDILTFGSTTLWNDLLGAGLVDELHLMVGNGVLGSGVPAFGGAVEGRLPLRDVRRLPDSDHVLLVYAGRAEG
jgi:dihydrofolate reductase